MRFSALAAGLLACAAVVTAVTPASASAGPSQSPAPAAAATAAPAKATDASSTKPQSFTKGTAVWFVNETSAPVWVREHHIFDDWYGSEKFEPGESKLYTGKYGGVDDVQLRLFRSKEDAAGNSVFKAIEVDAENPAYSSPWMSVSYISRYYSVGEIQWYVSPIAGASFMGQRQEDRGNYKYFDLRMKTGWK